MSGRALLALMVATLALAFAGCAEGNEPGNPKTPNGPVDITVWHSMPDPAGGSLQAIADRFNASQERYRVGLVFQGGYTDSLNKLINSSGSGNTPNVIQLSDVSTQIMVDSGVITPVQEFIDEENYDLFDFEPKAVEYYTIDGVLYAMPFNMSGPILYYDRLAFEEAGLDPDSPPSTLEEVREYSQLLVRRDEAGDVTRYGISLEASAWFFEQMLAKQGALFVNNENGRNGRATEVLFGEEPGVKIFEWWDGMVRDGLAYNAGGDEIDAFLKLATGEAVMTIGSTAALRAAIGAIALVGGDPFQYDTGPMPGPEGDGGITPGGAALWILNDKPEEEQLGAWEFVKFAASPEQQAQWHSDTGYFPNRLSAYEEPVAVKAREEFPQFMTAVEQLRAAPSTSATAGALVGPLSAVRQRIVAAFDQVLVGGGDPERELAAAAEDANAIIEEYNRTAP